MAWLSIALELYAPQADALAEALVAGRCRA